VYFEAFQRFGVFMGSRALPFGGARPMSVLFGFDHFDQEAPCRGMIL
jgi:hypothetical protein